MNQRLVGIYAALTSALFLGLAPIFGKQAILLGLSPVTVVAFRTSLAALLLLVVMVIFQRQYLYIYPAGLLGCLLAGGINGLGSLFYYGALGRIDASVGQLLYAIYPLFVAMWMLLDKQPPSRLTLLRLILTLPALYLLTQTRHANVDLIGMLMMLISSALYALHLPINQRVLLDMPAPTVTLYTLIAMSAVVVPAFIFSGSARLDVLLAVPSQAWGNVLMLALVTFLSRVTLFLGVKHLGGMQTAILGLSELLVTVIFAHLWLGETLSLLQWLGVAMLMAILGLVMLEKPTPKRYTGGWLSWLRPPGLPPDFPWQPHE